MNWKRWIRPGLVVSLFVAVIAVLLRDPAIERDLGERVAAALVADGQLWATAEVSSRDVTIRGRAPSTEAQAGAVEVAATVRGVRSANDGTELLPIASPYVWMASREGPGLILSGHVPSEGSRALVLAAARRALPESEIRDEMELARGAPLAFNSGSAYALEGLADLSEGKATLTDATLAVSGTAADALTYARVRTEFPGALPASITLGSVDVLPPRADPFVWSAEFDGESVAMVGYVPSEVVHQTLLATVRATLPGVRIEDGMALASGEPIGFAEAATFAVGAMARLSRGGVTLDGLALDVSGNAKSVDDHEALLASLSGPFPVGMSVVAAAVLPAPVSPYGWEGERTNGKVVLSGYVPNAAMRDELHATALALFAEGEIDDRIRVAAGEPRMDWIGAIKFAMGELTRLSEGRVAIGDQTYTIEGEARTAEDYLALVATNEKTLPASLTLAAAEILPPAASPYVFTAEKSGGRVVVGGFVPDEASRESIFAAVHRKFGRVDVVGDLTFASGAPDGYANAAATALQMLSRLAGGRVEVADTNVKLDGFAYRGGLAEGFETSDDLALPDGFSLVEANVSERQGGQSVSAERCSQLLQATLPSGNIEFDGTDPEILPDSFGFLDRIAATVARCPDVPVEVGAHTDSEGSASRNRDRTLARAEAIVDYLADAGVRRERMTAVGYGEDNPVADNDTDAGKAANRRIEFSLELPSPG